ncbi:hypothetical protein B0T26DRAFT_749171 [Lasiosphaeria miniovina]|uniref:Uncharacterized protein n=1 Tax=Lasiosphaeria miniovina TaxID=1954250 RepID=A0AA40ATD9_9PEZI|nr:uncharacterized protein B0T26DRAFT_749171 [Lasiosphaeria miniovina]KAK0721678.1 hypothetical protein B0T26DRAFT_749171 [Lasiosphaeria miniovina]
MGVPFVNSVVELEPRAVGFLGFQPAFWGDIAGEVVHVLAARSSRRGGALKQVVYLGKLGALRAAVHHRREARDAGERAA